ncbi:MAG: OsmC family protein [Bacteroidia bacterium]|nr:OsmC family protein [Bacteroidia bacterium]
MTIHNLTLNHHTGMKFSTEINGFPLILNGATLTNDKPAGISPKKLLLAAITGCTAMDITSLLEKMRVHYTDFSIVIEAPLGEEHPKTYLKYDLVYKIRIDNADRDKMEKAVNLSMSKYCGVSAMLGKSAPVNFRIEYL